MRARALAAITLSGVIALVLAGCSFWMPPQTNIPYDPSDGTSVTVGDLQLRNVLVITEDGELGNLVGTAVNTTGADIDFSVQWDVDGTYYSVELTARANGSTRFGTDGEQVALEPLGVAAGGLLDAVVHIQGDQKGAAIPVLDATFPEYGDAIPTPTPTPTPTETAAPEPEATETPAP